MEIGLIFSILSLIIIATIHFQPLITIFKSPIIIHIRLSQFHWIGIKTCVSLTSAEPYGLLVGFDSDYTLFLFFCLSQLLLLFAKSLLLVLFHFMCLHF